MTLLSKLFGRNDPLKPKAEQLVQVCSVMAIAAFIPMTKHYPFLEGHSPEKWDFYATVGAVVVGLNGLARRLPEEKSRPLFSIILNELNKWDHQGVDAVHDCQEFAQKCLVDGGNKLSPNDPIGMWVLWNMLQLQRVPTRDEANAASAIGYALAAPLHDWWD